MGKRWGRGGGGEGREGVEEEGRGEILDYHYNNIKT